MTPFLQQVATHYFEEAAGNISRRVFVFPNRRSMLFFRKYLGQCAADKREAMFAPRTLTMNEFFAELSGMRASDRIQLMLELYGCYSKLRKDPEPLDDFIFWGDMLLSDFDDIDKYLVDAEHLFTNVSEFKDIQDYASYLSERQMEALEKFIEHFTLRSRERKYKKGFLKIWDILWPLYRDFRSLLASEGRAYEGMMYRSAAEAAGSRPVVDILAEVFPGTEGFVFVGLNALNECEKKVMAHMRDAGAAEFCWDYCSEWIKDPHNRSSLFLQSNVKAFPQAFEPLWSGAHPELNVLSIPSSSGQAFILEELFKRMGGGVGIGTAVVLPDETMLLPLLDALPPEVKNVNVTMGYPMSGSAIWGLMEQISAMQMHLRQKNGKWFFYHRQVVSILSNTVFKACITPEEQAVADAVKAGVKYYIPLEDLAEGPLMSLVFRPVVKDPKLPCCSDIETYQTSIVEYLGRRLAGLPDMALETDFAREFHLAIGRLKALDLPVLPATYFRILGGLVGRASVPFRGEPLQGLQIMGPLETRGLDFENLVILNCNEGMFPRKSSSESFIPAELRRGFSLPTYEYQDAVWAYYFYRLLQRAKKVWMVCDSRTDISRSGEESRYIKQLEMHFGAEVKRHVFSAGIVSNAGSGSQSVAKTDDMLSKMHEHAISASSLQNYIVCPAKFLYANVERLIPEKEVEESLDAAKTGTVFHLTMEALYKGMTEVTDTYLRSVKDEWIKAEVDKHIVEVMNCLEVTGRNLVLKSMIVRYVRQTIRRELELMASYGVHRFSILGVEKPLNGTLGNFRFYGVADRIDSFNGRDIRIVDYKTGRVLDSDLEVNDDNAEKVVKALFEGKYAQKPKIALQLYLYDRFIPEEYKGKNVINSIYQPQSLFRSPIPEVKVSRKFKDLMEESIGKVLEEMDDKNVPFRRTSDEEACKYCDFKDICGR